MRVCSRLLSYLKPFWPWILLTSLFSLVVVSLQAVSIWIGAEFIQRLLTGTGALSSNEGVGSFARFLNQVTERFFLSCSPYSALLIGMGILTISGILTVVFRVAKAFLFSRMNQRIIWKIRVQMFEHLTLLNLSFSRRFRPGEIASLFSRDADQLEMALIDIADRLFMQPVRLILAVTLMCSLSVRLTVMIFIFLLLSGFIIHKGGRHIEKLSRILMEKMAHLQGHLTEYLSSVILSRSMAMEEKEISRFDESADALSKASVQYAVVRSLVPQLITCLFTLSEALLLTIGGYEVLVRHSLTGDSLVKMALLLPTATYPLESLATLYLSLRISMASAKRIFDFLDQKEIEQDLPDAKDPLPFREKMIFQNVTYRVGEKNILESIHLEIPAGKIVVVQGPSGSGKSTLLSLMAGFIRPSEGVIRIDGENLRTFKGSSWRKRLGIVIQEPILLNGTVRDNLVYGSPDAGEERMIQVMREALLWDDTCVFYKGLETPVGNRGEMISGGERQRLTIARALLHDPDIFLMDEPSAMLDEESRTRLRDTILSVHSNRTIVLVTHDPFLIELGQMHIHLNKGRMLSPVRNP